MTMTRSQKVLQLLRDYESPNVTFMEPDGSWPIVWERAKGCEVLDVEGKKYLDLTAAFGVAAAGHANPRVVRAGQRQMEKLLHAMGDVHPHACKANLARELSRLTFERWSKGKQRGKTIFCNSGFEAVEAALKTARIETGRSDIIAFEGAYHGLGYGALNATHRNHFREPFRNQLREFAHFVPFPTRGGPVAELKALAKQVRDIFESGYIGAVLLEPIQVRGGVNIPPPGLLPLLRQICDEHRALLIFDEIYTGLGRTGKWFACEHFGTVPDIVCIGKALTGGFPLSACVGQAELMDTAWPVSTGEAIHTSTFLGHPVGCAMALAQIEEIEKRKLVQRSAALGKTLLKLLRKKIAAPDLLIEARGLGLLACVELRKKDSAPATETTLAAIKAMLARGFILLPEGEHASVISFTPPLTITDRQLNATVKELARILGKKPAFAQESTSVRR